MFSLGLGRGFGGIGGGKVSSGFLRSFGFGIHTWFLGGAFGGSVNTPSLGFWELETGAKVEVDFSSGFKPLASPILP